MPEGARSNCDIGVGNCGQDRKEATGEGEAVASPTRMKIETRVWANAGKIPKALGGDEQRLGGAQATSQRSPFSEK